MALKVGKSDHAQRATVSHTASLAGGYAGASAILSRLGAAQVEDIPTFLETLKLAHFQVDMPNGTIAGISCSGGEASLIADTAEGSRLVFPPLSESQFSDLRAALGPKVALNNPIDYHTYIWRDTDAMTATFAGMSGPETDLSILITDYPTTDGSDWECATDAVIAASQRTKRRYAVAATLPEFERDAQVVREAKRAQETIDPWVEANSERGTRAGWNREHGRDVIMMRKELVRPRRVTQFGLATIAFGGWDLSGGGSTIFPNRQIG